MKALIWFLCFLAFVLINTALKSKGIVLGGIPTTILFGVTWWAARRLCASQDHRQSSILKDLVAWCTTSNSNDFRCGLPLRAYIHNAQLDYLPNKYHIRDDSEWNDVLLILDAYQKDLLNDFFSNRLYIPKSKYAIQGEMFFFNSLYEYLGSHQYDGNFRGHQMHKRMILCENDGTQDGSSFGAEYELSDFAVAYHKLLLIAHSYCKNCLALNPNKQLYSECSRIEMLLDGRRPGISCK